MPRGTLAVIATDTSSDRETVAAAVRIAEAEDAHLDIHGLGIEMVLPEAYVSGAAGVLARPDLAAAEKRVEDLEAELQMLAPTTRAEVQVHRHVVLQDALASKVVELLRFADRAVLTAPSPGEPLDQLQLVESALFAGRCPAVVLPTDPLPAAAPRPERVVLAWDDSDPALAAARAALPLMRRAGGVEVVLVDPPAQARDRSDPGGAIAQFLARHGLRVEVTVLARTRRRISDVLRRHVLETGADALVMGAWGHSRLREAVFGGTTRDLLADPPVPLWLAR
ncbi:Universal stress protein (Usp) [Oceanicola granulosus HTCC2516]|uniref:Universal stress protein (Usp) n=1 Tax=Oceanicola granulosus (strain ATCC BAA-861 / DSM 15982 / KCTC 12143 / HTCC2516) TaxID=314256 RepID=Q2CF75_OCEGH|nr:universal stress protein [Oceanicola granulosus]EAR51252.1 Universal stress protein (Usp) [Oceanicola granulosus HTCC2516]